MKNESVRNLVILLIFIFINISTASAKAEQDSNIDINTSFETFKNNIINETELSCGLMYDDSMMSAIDEIGSPEKYTIQRVDRSWYGGFEEVKLLQYFDKVILSSTTENNVKVNTLIQKECDKFLESYENAIEITKQYLPSEGYHYSNYSDAMVTHNKFGILSIRMEQTYHLGGSGGVNVCGLNYNLNTGEELKLTDIFSLNEYEIENYLKDETVKYIYENPNMLWQDAVNTVKEKSISDFNYYIQDDNIFICYPRYELAAGASGCIVVQCPIVKKQEIKVILNNEKIEFDQPPIMINDRVMVPIRAVAEKMGDTVKWSSYLNSALIVHADRMVIFKNNGEQALIYADPKDSSTWSSYYCDVPPQVINDRTLTPVRAIGECLGAKVDWDGDTQTVIINYDKNTSHTLKENAFTQLNAYYSSLLQASDFTTYSDETNEFYNNRSNWADAFIIFWDDWTISLDILASGEKTNVYMLKNCFAEILSEIPDSDVKDFDVYTEILDWLSKTSKLADIDFTKVDKVVNISVQTANSLSKFGNAIDKAGTALDFTGVGIDVLAELLSDYSTGMLYIDTLRNSFKNSGIEDEVIYTALDELENDYVNKCTNTLIENATSMSSSALLKLITSGAFNVASFGKDILNWVVDNDDKADTVKNINCIYLFNEYIDKAYSDVRNNLITDSTKIDDYIRLFNFQKIVKMKMYESMERLRKKSDQYTQTRINEQLDNLRRTSYIIWE